MRGDEAKAAKRIRSHGATEVGAEVIL